MTSSQDIETRGGFGDVGPYFEHAGICCSRVKNTQHRVCRSTMVRQWRSFRCIFYPVLKFMRAKGTHVQPNIYEYIGPSQESVCWANTLLLTKHHFDRKIYHVKTWWIIKFPWAFEDSILWYWKLQRSDWEGKKLRIVPQEEKGRRNYQGST